MEIKYIHEKCLHKIKDKAYDKFFPHTTVILVEYTATFDRLNLSAVCGNNELYIPLQVGVYPYKSSI